MKFVEEFEHFDLLMVCLRTLLFCSQHALSYGKHVSIVEDVRVVVADDTPYIWDDGKCVGDGPHGQ